MNLLAECTLVYIEESTKEENDSPLPIEHLRKIKCWDRGLFGSSYYVERDRDMQSSVNLRIQKRYTENYNNGQLRYVDYKGTRYSISNILRDRAGVNRGGLERYRILDCQEDKM